MNNSNDKRPKVGVGVIVCKDGKVLFGKRKGSHGSETWSLPGGHLEFSEEIFDCAQREVLEETGIEIKNLKLGPYTNDFFQKEDKHYITLYVIADYASGTVEIKEPNKCEEWRWVNWTELPTPLFTPIQNLLKSKFSPFA